MVTVGADDYYCFANNKSNVTEIHEAIPSIDQSIDRERGLVQSMAVAPNLALRSCQHSERRHLHEGSREDAEEIVLVGGEAGHDAGRGGVLADERVDFEEPIAVHDVAVVLVVEHEVGEIVREDGVVVEKRSVRSRALR